MKKAILTILAALMAATQVHAQLDSTRTASLDALMSEYFQAMLPEDIDFKCDECDRMIGTCQDSLTRQYVATSIFKHFESSKLMGDETVAIHVYDKWFGSGLVRMQYNSDQLYAEMYANVNRNTLIGETAPQLTLYREDGKKMAVPTKGRSAVVFFYSPGCDWCTLMSDLLPKVVEDVDFTLDVFNVCVCDDKDEWQRFAGEHFKFDPDNRNVRVWHLWDPEDKSDFERLYGVVSTPRLFLLDAERTVLGRRLDPEALQKLLPIARAIQLKYDEKHKADRPDGWQIVSDTVEGRVRHITAKPSNMVCCKQIDFDIRCGRIYNLVYKGGCNGNLQAIGRLVEGMKVKDAVKKLDGVNCSGRGTSCSDQLARVLKSLQ